MTSSSLVTALFVAAFGSAGSFQAGLHDDAIRPTASRLVTAQGERIEIQTASDQRNPIQTVEVCLRRGEGASGSLGIDLASVDEPRYVVEAGQGICGRFAPVRQKFSLWKGRRSTGLVPVLHIQLDLWRYAGRRIDVYWLPGQR